MGFVFDFLASMAVLRVAALVAAVLELVVLGVIAARDLEDLVGVVLRAPRSAVGRSGSGLTCFPVENRPKNACGAYPDTSASV